MRPCSICILAPADLAALEAAVAADVKRNQGRAISRQYGIDEKTLRRHRLKHMGTITAPAKAPKPLKLPKLKTRDEAEAFAGSDDAPPQLRTLEDILRFLEREAHSARSDAARLKAADMLKDLLPPPPPATDLTEPTPQDARRLCEALFGDAVTAPPPADA